MKVKNGALRSFSNQTAYAITMLAIAAIVFTTSQPAAAKIVYTPANVTLKNSYYYIDFKYPGSHDVEIAESNSSSQTCFGQHLFVADLTVGTSAGGGSIAMRGFIGYAAQLIPGEMIPGSFPFSNYAVMRHAIYGPQHVLFGCSFVNRDTGGWLPNYLGLAFPIAGKMHYGWAEVSAYSCGHGCLSAILSGYAYETIAGKPIKAGKK